MLDDYTYDNEDISFKLDGLAKSDILESKKSITFRITFYYSNNTVSTNNELKSILNFEFDLPGTLINNVSAKNLVFGRSMPKSEIETIYTLDNIDIPETAIATWDATQEQNGTITAWILDEDNNGLYELYIGTSTGVILLPANSDWFFSNYNNVKNIDTTHLDTSKVTNISYMFRNCNSLIGLDLSNFNTSNVTTMSYMFFKCYNLASLDLSGFDTSKVTYMADMFSGCKSLTSLVALVTKDTSI